MPIAEHGGDVEKGLIAYGTQKQEYYGFIKDCVDSLDKGPNSIDAFK